MQLIILDADKQKSVRAYCDHDVISQIPIYCKMLSAAHKLEGSYDKDNMVTPDYYYHPIVWWIRESSFNYKYLADVTYLLAQEFENRYKQQHYLLGKIEYLLVVTPSCENENEYDYPYTPKDRKQNEDCLFSLETVIEKCRAEYINERSRYAMWRYTNMPDWYPPHLIENVIIEKDSMFINYLKEQNSK